MTSAPDADFVFNIVWTGRVFSSLRFFVCSLMHHSDARFRFVANACTAESLSEMQDFAEAHSEQVVEVLEVSPVRMRSHGFALDEAHRQRDDGDFFCMVDADILAKEPFLDEFRDLLSTNAGVTSGRTVWNDDNVVPRGSELLAGRHFYDEDGFVYGCPHMGMYRRAALEETLSRWTVGFGSQGEELPAATKERLAEAGQYYRGCDTGKVVNILLQLDGNGFCQYEHRALMHIGGMSHFLSPPGSQRTKTPSSPAWVTQPGLQSRARVARYTADTLRCRIEGRPAPELPDDIDAAMEDRLIRVRKEIVDLVDTYRDC